MSKQESQIIKGIAILLMIFLHLFNNIEYASLYQSLFDINGLPIEFILTRACNPVPFFLLLGGYGLFYVYQHGDTNRWKRVFRLYLHWWIILIIFVSMGHFIKPHFYPGSLTKVLANISGLDPSYNSEVWFLLPYVILSFCSRYIFNLYARFKAIPIILATLFIHLCTSFCISRYGVSYLFSHSLVYNLILPFHLLFNFSLGALALRENWFNKLSKLQKRVKYVNILALFGLILLIAINCVFKYNFFYAFLFICLFSLLKLPKVVSFCLIKLGDNSMNMWMIHSWFCYYLFKGFTYSFTYPIIIFLVLVLISYVGSLIINFIARPIERLFMTKKQVDTKPIL